MSQDWSSCVGMLCRWQNNWISRQLEGKVEEGQYSRLVFCPSLYLRFHLSFSCTFWWHHRRSSAGIKRAQSVMWALLASYLTFAQTNDWNNDVYLWYYSILPLSVLQWQMWCNETIKGRVLDIITFFFCCWWRQVPNSLMVLLTKTKLNFFDILL